MTDETIHQIEQIIGYKFSNPQFLDIALTHASAVDSRFDSNERLEFLGDAVLGSVICQTIFQQFGQYLEGDLTKVKSFLVSRRTCARIAKKMGIHKFMKAGKGLSSYSTPPVSVLAGLLEAVIAAVYLDSDFTTASNFVLSIYKPLLEQSDAKKSGGNFKSILQQYSQQHFGITPCYELLDERGPDNNKCFETQVMIGDRCFPSAWGNNKKQAEQKAAFNALTELGLNQDSAHDADD